MLNFKRLLVIALCVLLYATVALAQKRQREAPVSGAVSQDVIIIIQQQQVRFTAQKPIQEMQLQIFDPAGELVYDSGAGAALELNWPLQNANGEAIRSGLYAYTLSIKEAGAEKARERRGHFIIDRAADREGATDKLWVTSRNDNGVGVDLTVARDGNATVAGTSSASQWPAGQQGGNSNRGGEGEAEPETQSKASTAAAAGTIGRIAKFTSANDLGDSVMTEQNGRISIGTGTPSHRLAVVGGPAWTGDFWGGALELENAAAIAWRENTSNVKFGIGRTETGLFFFRTNSPLGATMNGPIYDFKMDNAGNVGIGQIGINSDLSGAKLNLMTAPNSYGLAHSDGAVTVGSYVSSVGGWLGTRSNHSLHFFTNNSNPRATITTTGNVGIGTTTPGAKLHVEGSGGPIEAIIKSNGDRAFLSVESTITGLNRKWSVESGIFGTPGLFGIYDWQANRAGLTIDTSGLVAVRALQLTGGADFAENFDVNATPLNSKDARGAARQVAPGMVVSIDSTSPGKLKLSAQAYDRRVAGIISGAGGVKPGMTMGQEGTLADGKHPVALSGRVYVWVDATRGAVKPGDLLTTSSTPGHAMKAAYPSKAQGAIIGKAMTGLKRGKGLVLALVTLQ